MLLLLLAVTPLPGRINCLQLLAEPVLAMQVSLFVLVPPELAVVSAPPVCLTLVIVCLPVFSVVGKDVGVWRVLLPL